MVSEKKTKNSGKEGIRLIPFEVRNGPAIAVEGIKENTVVDGVLPVMINAYTPTIQPKGNYSNYLRIFRYMAGINTNKLLHFPKKHIVLDLRDIYVCSFTEFFPFCNRLYYFSGFKDFNTLTRT